MIFLILVTVLNNSCGRRFSKILDKPRCIESEEDASLKRVSKKPKLSIEESASRRIIDKILSGEDVIWKLEELNILDDDIEYVMAKALANLGNNLIFCLLDKLIKLHRIKFRCARDEMVCNILIRVLNNLRLGDLEFVIIFLVDRLKLKYINKLCGLVTKYEFVNLFDFMIKRERFSDLREIFLETLYLKSIINNKAALLSIILSMEGSKKLLKSTFDNNKNGLILAVEQGHINIVKTLLNFGIKIKHRDKSTKSALVYAVISRNRDIVAILLSKGADINVKTLTSCLLIYAISNFDIGMVKLLIENKININVENKRQITPLIYAVKKGRIDIVELLLESGIDINCRNSLGKTPLMYALLSNNSSNILEFLIDSGADINAKDKEGKSVLMNAIILKKFLLIAKLVKAGANVNASDNNGKTVLMYSLVICNTAIFGDIFSRVVDINAKDNDGNTALIHAIQSKSLYTVEMLLKRTPFYGFVNIHGETILIIASKLEDKSIFTELCSSKMLNINNTDVFFSESDESYVSVEEITKRQLTSIENINAVDKYGYSTLILATIKGSKKLVSNLIKMGSNINHMDNFGNTALFYALASENIEIAKLLLKNGALVKEREDFFFTELMYSVILGDMEIISKLLDLGAEINAKDRFSETALIKAVKKGDKRIVDLLLQKGADVSIASSEGETALSIATKFQNQDIINLFNRVFIYLEF